MKTRILLLFIAALMLPFFCLQAQEKNDTINKEKKKEKPVPLTPYHWNVIKFNPTPMLVSGLFMGNLEIRNITLSYERLITKKMSLALQAGYLVFPRFIDDTVFFNRILIQKGTKYGVNLALDYRYYPFQRNRHPAPDGVYIGAYLSYYGFHFQNPFEIIREIGPVENGAIKGNLNIVNVGLELGYQFIFWKRFSLDLLLFGPSVSSYGGDLTISGNLDPTSIQNIDEELAQKLMDRFPLLRNLFTGEDIEFTGSKTTLAIGFKYSLQLGFHF